MNRFEMRRALAILALAPLTLVGCTTPTESNQVPQVSIGAPATSSLFDEGESISFTGSASDAEDGALTGTALQWTSDLDGAIGTGGAFSRSDLSPGQHTVTLTATDSEGESAVAQILVTVNQLPVAQITAPTSGASEYEGQSVSFMGSASDPEDGSLTGFALVWTSDLDGQIGTDASFSTSTLSSGDHVVTLTATDSDGGAGSASVDLTIIDDGLDPPIVFDNWILPLAYPSVGYTGAVDVSGGTGTFDYQVITGSLPSGLGIDGATGMITGSTTASGVHHFRVEVTSGMSTGTRAFSLTVSTLASGLFNLQIANVADALPSVPVQTALDQAVAKWEEIIAADITGLPDTPDLSGACSDHGDKVPIHSVVDDILILADLGPIDGQGMTLGQAGPCGFVTGPNALTTVGQLILDSADLAALTAVQLRALVFHEIGHVVGIGTLWNQGGGRALMTGHDPTCEDTMADPRFVGESGVAAYTALDGIAADITVESTGGCGTANSHWRESTFVHEIMTGFIAGGNPTPAMPISTMTIGSVEDIGYTVNMGAAEAYTLPPGALRLEGALDHEDGLSLRDDALILPLTWIAPDGTVRLLEPPR